MSFDPSTALLQRAYDKVSRRPDYVASLIVAWGDAFGGSVEAELGVAHQVVLELGTCLRPRPSNWLADVAEIATACGIDPERLVGFLRAVEAVQRFGDAPQTTSDADGRLLAARDLDDGDDE